MGKSKLNYIKVGSGRTTLIFFHFFGGSMQSWAMAIDYLKKDFTCIAIDFRGFGNSEKPKNILSIDENATDIIELIQQLNIDNYILIGHSMGGKIALAIAAKSLAGLKSLILVAPSPPTPEPTSDKDKTAMLETFGNTFLIEKLIHKITKNPLPQKVLAETIKEHLQISQIAWNGWVEKGSQENISGLIPKINLPIKIISGENDPNFSTIFLRKEFTNYFPNAIFEEIKKTGHLIPVEKPKALADSIQTFINR